MAAGSHPKCHTGEAPDVTCVIGSILVSCASCMLRMKMRAHTWCVQIRPDIPELKRHVDTDVKIHFWSNSDLVTGLYVLSWTTEEGVKHTSGLRYNKQSAFLLADHTPYVFFHCIIFPRHNICMMLSKIKLLCNSDGTSSCIPEGEFIWLVIAAIWVRTQWNKKIKKEFLPF